MAFLCDGRGGKELRIECESSEVGCVNWKEVYSA